MQAASNEQDSLSTVVAAMRARQYARAEAICRDYLLLNPGSIVHLRMLGHALARQGRHEDAEAQFRFAQNLEPDMPLLHEDIGHALAAQQRFEEAVRAFEQAIRLEPRLPTAHKGLGQALVALGRGEDADRAYAEFLELNPGKSKVADGVDHLQHGRKDDAIAAFKQALRDDPENVDAMRFLASTYWQEKDQLDDAEALLARATQLKPDFLAAWLLLATVLLERHRTADAIRACRQATAVAPTSADAWAALGNAQARASAPEQSAEAFARAVAIDPGAAGAQMGYAHTLKTLGDQAGAVAAYRSAIAARPGFGEVYWSMANLKVFRFDEDEVAAMEQQLERGDLGSSADIHFRFALGKAYEDRQDYDRAWRCYHEGNQRQRMEVQHDPVEMEDRQDRIVATFDRPFLAAHAGHGCTAADPIFIVGLPRSGSTLIEQILASHSQVEGTAELPLIGRMVTSMGRYRTDGMQYPDIVREFRKRDWRAYGEQYMEESRRYRRTDKPYFTDKLPNNFPHVGLLHLILPNATVVNARRHPLDSCLGSYKQLFGKGQNFTYDMFDLAEYYKLYHRMMQHWHNVLPGKVLDVHYEETVTRLEWQVRRLLEHCGLSFEAACLNFHETERPVKTASSEQVRQPLYRGSLGKWRHYERHLGAWLEDLSGIIDELPEVVRNAGPQS